MTAGARIRWAVPGDAGDIVRLIRALAEYENEPPSSVKVTEADILRDGFGLPDGERDQTIRGFECLIAELGGAPVGLCLFFQNYSTWEGRAGLYVEDLFVEPTVRGHGLGRDLMAAVARVALDRDCTRVDLSVLDWNPTQDFYDRIRMTHMQAWRPYRMEHDAIVSLAQAAPKIDGDD